MQDAIATLIIAAAACYLLRRWVPEGAKRRIRRVAGTFLPKLQRTVGGDSIAPGTRELLQNASDHDAGCTVCDRCELQARRATSSALGALSGHGKIHEFRDPPGCH